MRDCQIIDPAASNSADNAGGVIRHRTCAETKMSVAKKNVLKGITFPMLKDINQNRLAFTRGTKQLCAALNTLALNAGVLIQNEEFNIIDGKDSSIAIEGSTAAKTPTVRSVPELPVQELLVKIEDSVRVVRNGLAVVAAPELKSEDVDEGEEITPYDKETDADRPAAGTATKQAVQDAYDARKELEIQAEIVVKMQKMAELTMAQIEQVSKAANTIHEDVEEALLLLRGADAASRTSTGGTAAASFVPARPSIREMMKDENVYRLTYDHVMMALKVVLGPKFDEYTSDQNLGKGEDPVNMTPHLIWRRAWLSLSDKAKGNLDSKPAIDFYQKKWLSRSTHVKEVADNVRDINELQDLAREASQDGIGPTEDLKIDLFLQAMREGKSELWLSTYASGYTFKQIKEAITLDAKTRDLDGDSKPRAYVAKEVASKEPKKYPKQGGSKVPPHVKCFQCG